MSYNSLLNAALGYARRGWYVYPSYVKNGAALVYWKTESTTDETTIRDWWRKYPTALICMDCGKSGVDVIDLDVKPEKDGTPRNGPAVLHRLEQTYGTVPKTLAQRTPSGGTHLLYESGGIKNSVSVIGKQYGAGVDSRGPGGMIPLAPSAGYRWLNDRPLVAIPAWLVELAGTRWQRGEVGDGEFDALYSDEEFERLLRLIPVERYDDKHDLWLELMLACSHSSTVANGGSAFLDWTLASGPGNRVGYGSDADLIQARWDYNSARCNMVGGLMVGTFNQHVARFSRDRGVLLKSPYSAADDFGDEPDEFTEADAAAWRNESARQDFERRKARRNRLKSEMSAAMTKLSKVR